MSDYIAVFIALATLALVAFVASRMERKFREEQTDLDDLEDRLHDFEEDTKREIQVLKLEHGSAAEEKEPATKRFIVDVSEAPYLCLPADLDQANLIRRSILGHRWQTRIDISTGKVHRCKDYYEQMQDTIGDRDSV